MFMQFPLFNSLSSRGPFLGPDFPCKLTKGSFQKQLSTTRGRKVWPWGKTEAPEVLALQRPRCCLPACLTPDLVCTSGCPGLRRVFGSPGFPCRHSWSVFISPLWFPTSCRCFSSATEANAARFLRWQQQSRQQWPWRLWLDPLSCIVFHGYSGTFPLPGKYLWAQTFNSHLGAVTNKGRRLW